MRIPRPSDEQLARFADVLCEQAGLSEEVLAPEHRQLLINTTGGNPRQLKRFINRFILLYEMVGALTDAAAVIQLMVLQASYDNFFRLLANVPGDNDDENPLFEFSDYATSRQALAKGQLDRVTEILTVRGYEVKPEAVEQQFKLFEENLPADYPLLATDRQFCDLVLAMSAELKRELRRLARSDEVRVADPVMTPGPSTTAPPYPYETATAVVPGTTVLWIDDKPKPEDHSLLPADVNLPVATSTEEARRILTRPSAPIGLLISDIGRPNNRDAGLETLESIRGDGLYDGPVIFYTIRPTTAQVRRAGTLNAEVATSPDGLRSLIQRYLPVSSQLPSSSTEMYRSTPRA